MKFILLTLVLGLSMYANSQVAKPDGGTNPVSANNPSGPGIIEAGNRETVDQLHPTPVNRNILDELQRVENTKVAAPGMNGDITDPSMARKQFEQMRNESEKQVQAEMASYRNELMSRLIKEEYYGLINEPVQDIPNNSTGGISKLAKLKALKEMLQDHISKLPQPIAANTSSTNQPKNKAVDFSLMEQQLDSKIMEEENRFRMDTERRVEMESRRLQQNQNQNK